jgi:pimeloyl-ACP methyl ester carboxylesterase
VPGLIAALPEPVQRELQALDPAARGLSGLEAELILIHGQDDAIIPASESRALAAAWPPGQAALYVVASLRHVELEPRGIDDAILLWRAAYRLLAARDALPRPDPFRCLGEQSPGY